jgi:hypothetical protein
MALKHILAAAMLLSGMAGAARANPSSGDYVYAPSPSIEINRIYRVNRYTGEMGACQFGLQEGTVGVTLCYAAGDGAGKQAESGEYGLIGSNHQKESAIFRVNRRTGDISICYVLNDKVVCTPASR